MSESIRAIQFIGTQRSGSNLLRVMLNQLPEISAPHPPHILKTFFPLLSKYGDLISSENFFTLTSDVCEWVNNNPVTWEGVLLDPRDIFEKCRVPSLIGLFVEIYKEKARVDRATHWCCKSMESIYHVDEIEAAGVEPFYIYLYRDGRDVALSFRKAIVGPKHIYFLANKWKTEQDMSLSVLSRLPESRFVAIRYEDMIVDPASAVLSICNKLGIPFSQSIFEYTNSNESKNTASSGKMWQNLTKPIIGNNFNKYKLEFTQDDLKLFETIAGQMLNRLKYQTHFWPQLAEKEFSPEEVNEFVRLDKVMRDEVLRKADPDEKKKRMRQDLILANILSRKEPVS